MRRVVLAALVAAAGLITFDAPARAANAQVGILANAFKTGVCPDPAGDSTTTIQVGDSVTWTNCLEIKHNVTSDNGAFPLKAFEHKDDFASQQFLTPGTYGYKCTIHGFAGTVIVEGAAATTTTPATAPPTTAAATTTTPPTTVKATTTTADNINGAFDGLPPESTTSTTTDPTVTTRALGTGGDGGTSAGVIALLMVGLVAVGTAVALIMRRLRGGETPI
jgi:plastocyanin